MAAERAETEVLGILLEVFVADVLIVLGLAGQKYAFMQNRLERSESYSSESNDNQLLNLVDISFFSSGSTRQSESQPLVSGNERHIYENGSRLLSDSEYQSINCQQSLSISGDEDHSASVSASAQVHSSAKVRTLRSRNTSIAGFVMSKRSARLWLIGFIVYVVGQISEAVALSLASQTDIVSASSLAIFWNALISVYLFNEKFSIYPTYQEFSFRIFKRWDLFSYGLLMAGSAVAVLYAPVTPEDIDISADTYMKMWTQQPYCYFGTCLLLLFLLLSAVVYRNWGNKATGNLNAALLASVSGIISAFAITLSKVVMTLLKHSITGQHDYGIVSTSVMTFVWALLLILSFVLLNISLSNFEQGLIIPIYEVIGTLLQLLSGILYYRTYHSFSTQEWYGFLLGVFMMCWGIWLTAHREPRSSEEIDNAFVNGNSPHALSLEVDSNRSLENSSGDTFNHYHALGDSIDEVNEP
mmetsp:Transcript_2222/g.2557  ORF Transcript_2222/g.2557 Transcript_2222/m.2557 type:complete len:471 (-) Transcript_2222:385-1797(-)